MTPKKNIQEEREVQGHMWCKTKHLNTRTCSHRKKQLGRHKQDMEKHIETQTETNANPEQLNWTRPPQKDQ